MKRTLFVIVLVLGIQAQAQLPVLEVGDRLPYLYYWDTNWFDSHPLCDTITNQANMRLYIYPENQWGYYLGRPCITNAPLKVIGIAGAVRITGCQYFSVHPLTGDTTYPNQPLNFVLDTVVAHRKPEYFRLYQIENDSLYYMQSVRWDTATPQYKMRIPNNSIIDDAWDLYEAYFEKPVVVHDTFCVGGTAYNSISRGYDWDVDPDGYYYQFFRYIPTEYPVLWKYGPCHHDSTHIPNPPYYVIKHLYTSKYEDATGINGAPIFDTTKFEKIYPIDGWWIYHNFPREYWIPFFAIFDTTFVSDGYDTCMAASVTGLHVEEMNTDGDVAIGWDDSGVAEWQIEVSRAGESMDSGSRIVMPINYLQLTGLDTGAWYTVRVRTRCDSSSESYGVWSDTLLFYLPGRSCITPTGFHVVEVDSSSVALAWAAGGAETWQVQVGMVELGLNAWQTTTTQVPAFTVNNLPFNDAWYWARARVVCSEDFWSAWTDTLCFHVHKKANTSVNMVEQYTYLMPNPAREEVTVMSSFKIKAVTLYAADGKLLQQEEVNAVGTRLSLKGLPAGVYFVRVRTNAGMTIKRLLIE